jgi:hypothetical protein
MEKNIYKDKQEALDDISRLEMEDLPCLKMIMDDVFTLPLYFPQGVFSQALNSLGKINVKFSFSKMKPMISVGDWVIYYYINAEIIDFKIKDEFKENQKVIFEIFKMSAPVNSDKSLSVKSFSPFSKPFNDEIQFFGKICNTKNTLLIDKIIWDI